MITIKQSNAEQAYSIRPCTLIYIVLMALTVVTWMIGRAGLSGLDISLLVLSFALIKGLLIGDYFMGLKTAHGFWRWTIIIWLLLPGGLITWAFMISV